MAVNNYEKLHSTVEDDEKDEEFDREGSDLQWSLGSPLTWTTAQLLQQDSPDKRFAMNLRVFLKRAQTVLCIRTMLSRRVHISCYTPNFSQTVDRFSVIGAFICVISQP